ncbi:heme-binding domain-containing protein [Arenibacter sp. M-2]|uniref:heme-binding domain-containing protein n=1 Tax=Arenibacter sp. M-2 TaxID=3053612 RepID=UPI0025704491|nr:heme-binding domain-containing protein [Arenibacter sp. M-2]MDL5511292.1 heme-binding domain-containing protein [Arenibacter sp. M-2]
MLKKILLGLGVVLILIQFFRPEKNESNDNTDDISTKYNVPEDVNHLLKVSCNDCHSNKTEYPWYSNVQPVAWFLNNHVVDGKRHLNFSNFTKLPLAIQYHKFEEVVEMVEEKEMPIPSYTYLGLHSEANLTQEQRDKIMDWSKAQMAYLKANYPADSLVRKKRSKPAPTK